MESMVRFACRRPVAVSVFALVVVVLGFFSWQKLPLSLFPDLQSPTILVAVDSGARPAEEMERLYGRRIEQQLFTVSGLNSIEQVARRGKLIARVGFDWQSDIDVALIEVNKAVSSIAADPRVDNVRVRRFDPRQLPVLTFGLVAEEGRQNLAELRLLAYRQLAPALEQLDGVAEVRITGGRVLQVQVELDLLRMKAYGITVEQVRRRLIQSNRDFDVGTLQEAGQILRVRSIGRFNALHDIEQVVIRYLDDGRRDISAVKISDIATVNLVDAEITNLVRLNGDEGVGVSVYKESGTNTVAVSKLVRQAMARLGDDLPGITVNMVSDEAALVEDAINDVEVAAALGMLLAVIVLVFFLRSGRPIAIVAVAVPISILTTLFIMDLADQSLNLMTLAGLALGVGMLVDNTIVVIESIFRHRHQGDSPLEAAAKGGSFVGGAIVTSTLTTCVVFLPVLFIDGMAARLVSGISFTVVVALLASLLVALFLIPALSVKLLSNRQIAGYDPGSNRMENFVYRLLGNPVKVCLLAAILFVVAMVGLMRLGTELVPPSDPRQFNLRVTAPPGQQVESTANTVANVELIIKQAAGDKLAVIMSEVGELDIDDRVIREEFISENTAQLSVRLEGGGSATTVVNSARGAIESLYGAEVNWQVGTSALSKALGIDSQAIVIELSGNSLSQLRHGSEKISALLEQDEALWNVKTSFEGAPSEFHVRLDRVMADGLGVDLAAVQTVLAAALEGLQSTDFTMGDESHEVVIKSPRLNKQQLLDLNFLTSDGQTLRIGDVVEVKLTPGAREIFRRDQRRVAKITASVSPGYTNPEARNAAQQAVIGAQLPLGLSAKLSGEELQRQEVISDLSWAGFVALMLVLMVLAGSFESLVHPVTVLASIPVALIGVAAILVPLSQPIGIMAMLGLVVLIGVSVNDAILLVQSARNLIAEGMEKRKALARAASIRLRPIIMTTTTTILALLPLAIGSGESAQLRGPLAWTVVGGMFAATIGCLTVIPCVYLLLDRFDISSPAQAQE